MVSTGGVVADVALKVLNADMAASDEAMLRLREEARVLALLNHPNILSFFDLIVLNGRVTLVTQYVDGADLDTIRSIGPLPIKVVLEVAACVADALTTAWTTPQADGRPLHLTHRDIKPSNIRIGRHGDVKLLDFGIAKVEGRTVKTGTGLVVGSLPYIPPERFDADGNETAASDVYSLGCAMLEVFQGRRPFYEYTDTQRLGLAVNQPRHDRTVRTAVDNLGLPNDVRAVLLDMLAYEPSARPAPGALANQLRDLAEDTPGPSLKRWSRDFSWPQPEHVSGPLDGMTISEAALSKYNLDLVRPADDGSAPDALGAPLRPADAAPATAWHRNDRPSERPAPTPPAAQKPPAPNPPAAPQVVAEPPRPPPAAAATPPVNAAESGGRGGLLAAGAAALLLVGGGGATLIAAIALVVWWQWRVPDETANPPAETDAIAEVREPDTDGPATDGPTTEPAEATRPSQPNGAIGVAAPPKTGPTAPQTGPTLPEPTPATSSATCSEPRQFSTAADLGKVPDDVVACMQSTAHGTEKQTTRIAASRVLITHHRKRCLDDGGTRGASCDAYEAAQRYHLDELDQQVDMMYAFADYLYKRYAQKRSEEVAKWSDRAIAEKDRFAGDPSTGAKIDRLYELRARATYAIWAASNDESARLRALTHAIEWMDFRIARGKPTADAVQLCASAAGTSEGKCKRG